MHIIKIHLRNDKDKWKLHVYDLHGRIPYKNISVTKQNYDTITVMFVRIS